MKESAVLRKNKDMVTRTIDDETILMPIFKTSEEINCIYTLNKVASKVWDLIDGKKTFAKIRSEVLKRFDATEEEVNEEIGKLLKDLKGIKAVT